ncbi:PilZ domain-containing protein [Leptospira selangorensis]|uniref:PilZ domain-containing protein n=1 Tax=Leptospira selangorensis TaxID=2484982 RepID=A0A4R9GBU0_9LEPT|nr:PilZ domain-containing protein [Leptospira selangorensis]TGK09163.1 PilZ domain-containing protein [Leptospira selangorensis]TGM15893.1 PilZ domain-containing protein [Leptospira selangorensis]TGM18157.1 PilZ domain-containing protein [Leptospira selangorensis]
MQRTEIGVNPSQKVTPDLPADQRFYTRFRKDSRVKLFEGGNWSEGILVDISMIGASILSDMDWSPGKKIMIMSPMFTCEIPGEVIRKTVSDMGQRYAIVFHDLCDSGILEILNKIAHCR